jgi:amino acid adenylation domain-containing protein
VAVHLERDPHVVPALLGVLLAHAAFLVLDPAYPALRRARCAELAGVRACLIGSDGLPPALRTALGSAPLFHVDSLPPPPGPLTFDAAAPDDLAYVAFTSGTTGEPLGVLGEHGPLTHFLAWHAERWGLGPGDRFSVLSGLSHDPLLRELFTPLWIGGTVCVPDQATRSDVVRLAEWLSRLAVTALHVTPTLARALIGCARPGMLESIRGAFFAGEPLLWTDVAGMRVLAPGARCVNYYGTTETPQGIAYYEVDAELPTASVPVGKGIEGVELVVRNDTGVRCAPYEAGEIWVRSPYLTRGYLNADAESAARFREETDPSGHRERWFRTGDRGRYLPYGSVETLGRLDGQLALRGARIEPAEVEAALRGCSGVRDAVVNLAGTPSGERLLAAWIVAENGLDTVELRAQLRRLLPEAMIPARFLPVAALPLTPNGKVNRRALAGLPLPPAPEPENDGPADALEESLSQIWQEVLGAPVGCHEDFFELGGHSLQAFRLLAMVEATLGVRIPVPSFWESSTVSRMAALLREP